MWMTAIHIESNRFDILKQFKNLALMVDIQIQEKKFTESMSFFTFSEINAKLEEIDRLKKLKERYKTPINHHHMRVSEMEGLN